MNSSSLSYFRIQHAIHFLGCLPLGGGGDVGVGVQGKTSAEVAQNGRDGFHVYPVLQGQGSEGVAQVVEPHIRQPCPFQHPAEHIPNTVRRDGPTVGRREPQFQPGSTIEILAPLGNGFPVDKSKRTLLVGGGIGVPPLLGVAAQLGEKAIAVLGFRNKDAVILEEDFQAAGAKTFIATDDGSYGHHGLVTDLCQEQDFDCVMACGPAPMLKAVTALAEQRGVPCYVSLEERMACGIGACLGCAVALNKEDGTQYFGHVCKDGPVFESHRVAW